MMGTVVSVRFGESPKLDLLITDTNTAQLCMHLTYNKKKRSILKKGKEIKYCVLISINLNGKGQSKLKEKKIFKHCPRNPDFTKKKR